MVLVSPKYKCAMTLCNMQQSAIAFLSTQGMDIKCQAFYEAVEFHKTGDFLGFFQGVGQAIMAKTRKSIILQRMDELKVYYSESSLPDLFKN